MERLFQIAGILLMFYGAVCLIIFFGFGYIGVTVKQGYLTHGITSSIAGVCCNIVWRRIRKGKDKLPNLSDVPKKVILEEPHSIPSGGDSPSSDDPYDRFDPAEAARLIDDQKPGLVAEIVSDLVDNVFDVWEDNDYDEDDYK